MGGEPCLEGRIWDGLSEGETVRMRQIQLCEEWREQQQGSRIDLGSLTSYVTL